MHKRTFAILLFTLVALSSLTQAQDQKDIPAVAGNEKVEEILRTFPPRGVQSDGSSPTPPREALKTFNLLDGFSIDLMASEPDISQPLFLSWDSRGRMWVVQYRQYQYPAGLKVVRFDHHLRAVFDKIPEPPPNHVEGKDRLTVYEDTDGDGLYDTHKDVISGLNIATSLAIGHGGIWVLNPPYLLFYPDADGDDVPDSDPEVHLTGFGLQDTHSVANSMIWGPDGWLYGANGSTTGGTISSQVTPGVTFQGQCIWRYHPDTKIFEVYAEGGGNTFSLDIDSKGRVFSGTNGGNTRGWYYPQGSYARKNWGKHGPLTNPYAFGFFEAMRFEGDGRRFPQAFLIYEGGLFPKDRFDGNVIAPNAMQNLVWHSRRSTDGSTYRTTDEPNLVESADRWFRPVYSGVGPDGAVYIADWYDTRLSHVSPTDDWHKESGRVYRVRPSDTNPVYTHGDLTTASDAKLIRLFFDANKWVRRRAALELGWRKELSPSTLSRLRQLVTEQASLEALWALNMRFELTSELADQWLKHQDGDVRRWVVRILGDRHESHAGLVTLARHEADVQVRSQLAATARRVNARTGLGISRGLLRRSEDIDDLHLPLMNWWAIEAHVEAWDEIERFLKEDALWQLPLMQQHIVGRLMQRYAAAGTIEDLQRCARLIELAPDEASRERLIVGLNKAFQGRTLPPLPETLELALEQYRQTRGDAGVVLSIRQGDGEAQKAGLKTLQSNADLGLRIELARAFGEVKYAPATDTLLKLATGSATSEPALQRVALQSLVLYDDDRIPRELAKGFDRQISAEHDLRNTGCRTLASRGSWALALLKEVNEWRLRRSDIPADVVQRLRTYEEPQIVQEVERAFGKPEAISSPEKVAEIERLTKLLAQPGGDPVNGEKLFTKQCATCHQLYGKGQSAGPPLDNYDRGNLKFWLPAIIAPSIEIREGFQSYLALTEDARVVTGMIAAEDPKTVTLRTAENQLVVLPKNSLEQFKAIKTSLMPEDLLKPLSDDDIKDLFQYLMRSAKTSTTP